MRSWDSEPLPTCLGGWAGSQDRMDQVEEHGPQKVEILLMAGQSDQRSIVIATQSIFLEQLDEPAIQRQPTGPPTGLRHGQG